MPYHPIPISLGPGLKEKGQPSVELRESVIQHIRLMLETRQLQFRAYPLFGSIIRDIEHSLPFNPEENTPYIDPGEDKGRAAKIESWFEDTLKPAIARTLEYSLAHEHRFSSKPAITIQVVKEADQAKLKKFVRQLRPELAPLVEKRHMKNLILIVFQGGKLIDGSDFTHYEPIPLFY